jgi:Zn-dependent protease
MPFSQNWWVSEIYHSAGPWVLASWVLWVIGSIVLHELSHGWAAIRAGDRTPIDTGHMTWNPLVHMGTTSLIMFALIGIAWGAMPVDPSRFRRRYDRALVALAGPAMNLSLFVVCIGAMTALLLTKGLIPQDVLTQVFMFFLWGAILNFALMVFNLLPVPPLDGSRILADIFPPYRTLLSHPNAAPVAAVAFILVFFYAGDLAFGAATKATMATLDGVVSLLGGRPKP